jgi:transposase-like protein
MEETPDGAHAASGGGSRPDPELAERPRRRRFTAEYKLRIVREAAGSTRSGEIAAMLRREGLYTSHLTAWRKQQDAGALQGLEPRKRGPRGPSAEQIELRAEQIELRAVRAQLERAEAELATARRVIEVQGNVSALLEDLLAPKSATETTAPRPER